MRYCKELFVRRVGKVTRDEKKFLKTSAAVPVADTGSGCDIMARTWWRARNAPSRLVSRRRIGPVMLRRILIPLLAVSLLVGLIAYSQIRVPLNRVSGFIEADEVRLGSRVGGRVREVFVQEGQQVAAGQPLLELEPFDLLERENEAARTLAAREAEYQRLVSGLREEEVAQAKAQVDQLKAELDRLEAGPREQEVKAAEARLRSANAELQLAQQVFDRQSELIKRNAVSEDEFDRAKQVWESATAMRAVRENELELLRVGTRPEEIRAARAAVEKAEQAWILARKGYREENIQQARAARDAAQAVLNAIGRQKDELMIRSPQVGMVESLDLQPGDMVQASAPVMSIVDFKNLWVRAYVPQNQIGLQVGDRLNVTVDSFPNQPFVGEISFIARQAEFTPNNVQTPEERAKQVYRIKVVLIEPSVKVRPGMTADVWLDPVGGSDE